MVFTWNHGFLSLGEGRRNIEKEQENSRKKTLKNEKKEKWRMQRKSSNNNKYLCFYFSYKKSFFGRKHSLKKVVFTKELLYLRWNKHHLKLMIHITSSVSFWYRPCYKNILNYDSENKCTKRYDNIQKQIFFDYRADASRTKLGRTVKNLSPNFRRIT